MSKLFTNRFLIWVILSLTVYNSYMIYRLANPVYPELERIPIQELELL